LSTLQALQDIAGGRWTALGFGVDAVAGAPIVDRTMRLCEAVGLGGDRVMVLPVERMQCPGARRSLGSAIPTDSELIYAMSAEIGIPRDAARQMVLSTPRLREGVEGVTVGSFDDFDVAIGFLSPENAMHLIREWQVRSQSNLHLEMSTFMAVCGNLIVRSHLLSSFCVNVGCPWSRSHGGLDDDELAVAMPATVAARMIDRS
jgi:uncharacterized protein (DUF169 family)